MDDKKLLLGRVRELSEKAYFNNYVTNTHFLSASELAMFYEATGAMGQSGNSAAFNGATYYVYGGREDADRNVVCFLPTYLDAETFLLAQNESPEIISCIKITPVNAKFADDLNHRDYLGALMNLGIERDMTGDILCSENEAYIYVIKDIAGRETACEERIANVYVDKTNPTKPTIDNSKNNIWTNTNVSLGLSGNDHVGTDYEQSGIDKYQYSYNQTK